MIKKYIKILVTLMISMIIIITPCITKAVPQVQIDNDNNSSANLETALQQARQSFVERVINFYNNHPHNACIYDYSDNRRVTIRNGYFSPGVYRFDCVGWVNYAIHWFYGLEYDYSFYLSTAGVFDARFRVIDVNNAIAGDILIDPATADEYGGFEYDGVNHVNYDTGGSTQHVAVYIGNGEIVDMWGNGSSYGGLGRRTVNSNWGESQDSTCRFAYAARLISLDGVHFGTLPDGADVVASGSIDSGSIDLGENASNFQYSGMPTTVSVSGSHSWGYYMNKISEVFNYIIGIMFNAIKSIPIFIADKVQTIITNALNYLNGN